MDNSEKLEIYKKLFCGRDDVFARRWDKTGAYFPAYSFDWNEFNTHRAKGGSIKDFENKELSVLTNQELHKHLSGQQSLGIYPVVDGDSSYFLAADFDGKNWFEDSTKYMREVEALGLSCYLERSRSGEGGHVWIFFAEKYPCHKSRAIGLNVLKKALKISDFDKESSFDRLFPNQDFVDQDGFGNLIALPFQGQAARNGNTVFIDIDTKLPYENQLELLRSAKRHAAEELDVIYDEITTTVNSAENDSPKSRLKIVVGKNISINKQGLFPELVSFLKEELNFLNSEYLTKKRLGASLYQIQKYFRFIEESDTKVFLPRGFLSKLEDFLKEKDVKYALNYDMRLVDDVKFKSSIKLKENQQKLIDMMLQKQQGVLVAPPGSGKTIMGLEIIAQLKKPALILVHRKQLMDQWVERIQDFLNVPKNQIGQLGGDKKKLGKSITVGMLQSLSRMKDFKEIESIFGTIIVDECHHIPAKAFRNAISKLNSQYLYGLTATPSRKHNDEKLIYVYIGDISANMDGLNDTNQDISGLESKEIQVNLKSTSLQIPFDYKTDHFETIAKIISYDTERNKLISKGVLEQVSKNRKVLVLSERKEKWV